VPCLSRHAISCHVMPCHPKTNEHSDAGAEEMQRKALALRCREWEGGLDDGKSKSVSNGAGSSRVAASKRAALPCLRNLASFVSNQGRHIDAEAVLVSSIERVSLVLPLCSIFPSPAEWAVPTGSRWQRACQGGGGLSHEQSCPMRGLRLRLDLPTGKHLLHILGRRHGRFPVFLLLSLKVAPIAMFLENSWNRVAAARPSSLTRIGATSARCSMP